MQDPNDLIHPSFPTAKYHDGTNAMPTFRGSVTGDTPEDRKTIDINEKSWEELDQADYNKPVRGK